MGSAWSAVVKDAVWLPSVLFRPVPSCPCTPLPPLPPLLGEDGSETALELGQPQNQTGTDGGMPQTINFALHAFLLTSPL